MDPFRLIIRQSNSKGPAPCGVDGRVHLEPGAVRVTAELGFLLGAMKGTIESEIRRVLAERFR